MVMSGRSGLRSLGMLFLMYWPLAAGVVASIVLIWSMLLRSEPPSVHAPSSWSDVVRSGLPRPAGAGCFTSWW